MFDEQMGFRIQKNHPTAVLKALDQYAENAFNDVAQRSELYGQEVAGFLYSPYFFRRFIPIQFMEGLTRWKESGKQFPLVEYLAKAIKIDSAENLVFGNPRDPRIVPFRTPARIESNVPFVPIKEEFERLYSGRYYYGEIYRYPKALRIVYELKASGYSDEQITEILSDFANAVGEPVKVGIWTLKPAKSVTRYKYCNYHNEIASRAYQNGASSLSAKIIDSWFDYVNETGIFSSTQFCRVVEVDGRSIMEFARLTDGVYWNAFLNELKTLTILEQKNDFVFEERRNFLPLSILQRIPVKGELTYRSALSAIMESEGVSVAGEVAFSEDFRLCFLRAGIYYTIKNRVAFEGGNYRGTTELSMALNTALDDVFALDSEEALETFAEKEFWGSSTHVQDVTVARQVDAFGSADGLSVARQVNAFGSSNKTIPVPDSRRPVQAFGTPFSSNYEKFGEKKTQGASPNDHSAVKSGSGAGGLDFSGLMDDPEIKNMFMGNSKLINIFMDALNTMPSSRVTKTGDFLTNSKGEKARVGDTIKVEWLAPTIFGNSCEGTIAEIYDDRIVFDNNGVQPLEGIRDFTIIRRH